MRHAKILLIAVLVTVFGMAPAYGQGHNNKEQSHKNATAHTRYHVAQARLYAMYKKYPLMLKGHDRLVKRYRADRRKLSRLIRKNQGKPAAQDAVGRNIVLQGYKKKDVLRVAKVQEVRESANRLASQYQALTAPPPVEAASTGTSVPVGASSSASPNMEAIAQCESGGDPTAVDPSGTYRGKYQFDYGTWQSVGGTGDPAAAPEAEQDARAQALYTRSGSSPWPICGQ